jgi:hypothetical protein
MINFMDLEYDRDPAFVRLIRVVLSVSTVAAMPIAIAMMMAEHPASSVFVVFLNAILSAVSLFLSYRGVLWFGKVVFPLTILIAVTFIALNTYGLHDSSIAGFALVIIISSLFIGQKAIPLATLFTLLGVWVVAYADMTGINKSLIAEKTSWDAVAAVTFILVVAAASLNMLMSRLNSVLENVRRNENELQEKNSELEEIRASLEDRVVERTRVAESARAESESARINLEEQVWLANGQTQLADVMRGEQELFQLAENILLQVCSYMGAESGALFLLNDENLSLAGRYAFEGRPGFTGQLKVGEGLVGQAALDGSPLILRDIAPGARVISTGLVAVQPRSVIAFPFYANHVVIGVIEMAALFDFNEKHVELLNRLSETIGMGFITVQTRQRLMNLLAESQRQAEQFQSKIKS